MVGLRGGGGDLSPFALFKTCKSASFGGIWVIFFHLCPAVEEGKGGWSI